MKTNILTPWKRLIKLLELDRRDLRQIILYAVFAEIVALSVPLGIQAFINLLTSAQISTSWIILVILVTLGVGLQGILQMMQMRILENIQQKIFTRASFEFVYRFPKIKSSELYHYYPPELANRFFDTLTVQKGLSKTLISYPTALLQIFFGLVLLSFYHPFFIFFGAFLVTVIFFVFRVTLQKGFDTSLAESKQKYKVAHWIQEITRSLISFKIFGSSTIELDKNEKYTAGYLESRESHFKVLILQFIQMIGFKVLITIGLLIMGGLLVINQQMNIGQFVAAEIIILILISSVEKLITGLESFYDVLTSLEKIGQVVDKELELESGINPFESSPDIYIEGHQIQYRTPDDQININLGDFTIKTGDHIKLEYEKLNADTYLFKILSGIIKPKGGELFINHHSFEGIRMNQYRNNVGMVLNEQYLFEGTILDNITFGLQPNDIQDVYRIVENLGLFPFVKSQPQGIHTFLYAGSEHLHQSITRRIVLARAIYKKPKLLLLQNPLEDLPQSEKERIKSYLLESFKDDTLIVSSKDSVWETGLNRALKC